MSLKPLFPSYLDLGVRPALYDDQSMTVIESEAEVRKRVSDVIDFCNQIGIDVDDLKKKKVTYEDMYIMYKLFYDISKKSCDYRGSWHGIPRPEYAEPGIQGQVTANREEIESARLGENSLKEIIQKIYNYLYSSIYYSNFESFGAKGDGVTDDTEAIQRCIDENYGGVIISKPNKTYLITKPIKIKEKILIDFNNSSLLCKPGECCQMDYGIVAQNNENAEQVATILNLTIKGNYKCKKGVYVTAFRILELKNVNIENCLTTCIHVERDSATGRGSLIIDRMILTCTNNDKLPLLQNAKAIILDSTDCKISNVISNNFVEHIIVNSGVNFIKSWHGWNLNSQYADIINNSKFAVVANSVTFEMCYSDTLQYGIYLTRNADWMNIILNNFYYYINATQYPAKKNKPLPIFNDGMLKPQITITNSVFNNEWNNYTQIDLCTEPLNISITQSQLKGFKHQVNAGKIKYRSFQATSDNDSIGIDKRILYIKDSFIYLNIDAGIRKQINADTDIVITIEEATIKSRYGQYLQNGVPVNVVGFSSGKVYNMTGFYDDYKIYLTFKETIPSGKITLSLISNYNALETKISE